MPIFEFKCESCKKITEKIVKSDITYVECPNCSGKATKQLSAPGGFDLRGTGWFKGNASKPPEA